MNARVIRSWLLKQPRPVSLRLTVGDEVSSMPIGAESWASIAASVEAMDPDLVECLDAQGHLLRATRGSDDQALDPEVTTRQPVLPAMIDVNTLQLVAKLLAEAYKHSTETAFARLADLFAASNKRSENLEKSLATAERMLRKQFEDQLANAPAEEGGGLVAQMLSQFASGQASAAAGTTTPPNGKGHS